MLLKASAPGSLMLLGEHAVLEGGFALVAAVNYRMHVTLSPRTDSKIMITSVLGKFESDIENLSVESPFEFILTTLKKYQTQFPSGFNLEARSEFSHQIGFASSAAVTVATLHLLHEWLNIKKPVENLIIEAREIVRQVQGVGSGADVAACILGGVVAYQAYPLHAEKLNYSYPLTVAYSGQKTKTPEVIRYVNNHFKNKPEELKKILNEIAKCALAGIQAAKNHQHHQLGKIMNEQQVLMEKLKVNTDSLENIIQMLRQNPQILGAKISGSGLGDCAVGLGECDIENKIPCKIDELGVTCEKN